MSVRGSAAVAMAGVTSYDEKVREGKEGRAKKEEKEEKSNILLHKRAVKMPTSPQAQIEIVVRKERGLSW